jgi:hypothetical protein
MPKLKTPSEKGIEFVACRLTVAEKREVDALAEAEGLTLSDFFRTAITDRIAKLKARAARRRG